MADKLQISWDDLSNEKVDKKLKEQQAVTSTQLHYQQSNVVVPEKTRRFKFVYNALFYLSVFGAIGGLLGWGFGEILNYRPDEQAAAIRLIKDYEEILESQQKVRATQRETDTATRSILREGKDNSYFKIYLNPALSDDAKTKATEKQIEHDQAKSFIASLLFYGVSGVMIAVMLAIADSVVERNINGVVIYGSIGAVIGLAGGVVVAMLINRIHDQMIPQQEITTTTNRIITQVICWGMLGLFLAAAPGIILRNGKRLMIGMVGGLIGGVIGGLAYVPLQEAVGNEHISRLIAIVCIGLVAGLACGIIENVVKSGWVKVESGLITGKQFVLYRNPTFIGSHPMSHIYLFNDPHVGRRHACVHRVGQGFELEDLPLGTRTYVNGRPVTRQRLKNGDRIQVGATQFHFQERTKPA
ncbi:MAG: FHA domain-containing protein [Burkholderiales bacterium]|nr:FHA domain-containing protein [Phycisphaerae bacterium]